MRKLIAMPRVKVLRLAVAKFCLVKKNEAANVA